MIEQVDPNDPFKALSPGGDTGTVLPPVRKPAPAQTADQATKDALDIVIANQKIRENQLGAAAKPERIPAAAAVGIQENIKALREVDKAIASLARRPESIGPGTGMLGDYYTQWNDPAGGPTRADIGAIGAVKIHDLSGAAVSASEAPRFTSFVPKVDDTPLKARDNLVKFRDELNATVHEALDYYQPENGYLPYKSKAVDDFLSATPAPPQKLRVPPPTPLPGTARSVGEQGQTSTMLNIGDLGTEPRPGGPIMPRDPIPETEGYGVDLPPTSEGDPRFIGPPLTASATVPPSNPLTESFLKGVGNVVEGVGNIGGMVANPITAGVNWLAGREVMGKPDLGANLRAGLGLPGDDSALGTVLEAGSSALAPVAASSALARTPAILANPSALAAFTTMAKEPVRQVTAGIGGAASGEAARAAGAPWPVQLAANVAGSVAGYGTPKLLPSSGQSPADIAEAAAQLGASERQNVSLRRPMFDPKAREAAGNLEGSPGASGIVRGAYRKTGEDIETGIKGLTPGGRPQESADTAGSIMQAAAQRRVKSVNAQAKVDYGHARRLAGPDAAVTPRKSLLQLRKELDKFKETENLSQDDIAFLRDKVGGDLTKGPITIKGFQRIRRELNRQIIRQELKGSEAEAAAQRVINALRDDLADSLSPAAAAAFKKADANYSAGWKHINDVLTPFIAKTKEGELKTSGAAALAKLKTWASETSGGDPRRMSEFWNDLDPQEQLDVAATFMNRIGRETPEGDFSPDRFITAMKGVSPEARRTMFGTQGAKAVDDLITLSKGLQRARSRINFSGSGRTVKQHIGQLLAFSFLGGGLGSGSGVGMGTAAGVAGGAIAKTGYDALKASVLMNPKVSAWLARLATASTPTEVRQRIANLGMVIARSPELAEDLEPVKAKLEEEFGTAPGPAKLTAEDTVQ